MRTTMLIKLAALGAVAAAIFACGGAPLHSI